MINFDKDFDEIFSMDELTQAEKDEADGVFDYWAGKPADPSRSEDYQQGYGAAYALCERLSNGH